MKKPKKQKPQRKSTGNVSTPTDINIVETKDNSPYVFQRDKFALTLNIKELPWTEKQKAIIQLFLHKDTKALFLKGPAGTGKSLLAMYCGLQLLNIKKVSDLVLVRAAVEAADSKLGYLPGTSEEKLGAHMVAFHDKLSELLIKPHIAALQKDERLISCPISFARGLHFAAKFVCVDEYQNLTRKESLLMLSRIGEYSKVFLCGDPDQSDLPHGRSSFVETYNLFNNEESREQGIFCVELTEEDIVRSEFCKFITRKFKELPPIQHHKH
jgi:predicted ribonuclease YlaK